jgi:Spy/CpxP family protein refolding chaperone
MKNLILAGFMFAVLSAPSVSAQSSTTQRTPPTPAQIASFRVTRLTTLLTLTTAQQTQATSIFTDEETARSGEMTSMRAARTALQTAAQNNDLAGITTQATTIGNLTAQEVEARGKADAAFYAILSADQQARYKELLSSGFGGPGGPGGPGGLGGPGPGRPRPR